MRGSQPYDRSARLRLAGLCCWVECGCAVNVVLALALRSDYYSAVTRRKMPSDSTPVNSARPVGTKGLKAVSDAHMKAGGLLVTYIGMFYVYIICKVQS